MEASIVERKKEEEDEGGERAKEERANKKEFVCGPACPENTNNDTSTPLLLAKEREMSSLRFCEKCNNLMYPKELRSQRRLGFECGSCFHKEDMLQDFTPKQAANRDVVYRLALKRTAENKLDLVDTQVIHDPTLPRTNDPNKKMCGKCGHFQAVFFQAGTGRDSDMHLIFICCKCTHKWMI